MYFEFLPTLFLGDARGARGRDANAPFALSVPAIMTVGGEHNNTIVDVLRHHAREMRERPRWPKGT